MPFGVPEGYFESFQSRITERTSTTVEGPWQKAIPIMAVAASLALLLAVGSIIRDLFNPTEDITCEEYIMFSDNLISTEMYEDSKTEQYADAEIMDEDIVNYLIYIGAELESIELSK